MYLTILLTCYIQIYPDTVCKYIDFLFLNLFVLNYFAPVRASDDIQKRGLDEEEIGIEAYPEF